MVTKAAEGLEWLLERFSSGCRKTNAKLIAPTNHNRSKQRDEPIRIPSNYLQLAQSAGKIRARVQRAVCFAFAFHWLKKWREIFKRITKPSNCNRVTTFDCHSKFALHVCCGCQGIGINLLSRHFLPLYLNPL